MQSYSLIVNVILYKLCFNGTNNQIWPLQKEGGCSIFFTLQQEFDLVSKYPHWWHFFPSGYLWSIYQ